MNQPENTAPKGVESVNQACKQFQQKHDFRKSGLTEIDFFKAGVSHVITVINNRIAELEVSEMHNSTIVSKTRELRHILTLLQS